MHPQPQRQPPGSGGAAATVAAAAAAAGSDAACLCVVRASYEAPANQSHSKLRARYTGVKTVRFAKVVERSGAPEMHLVFVDPAKDRELQAAVKAVRVMTVFQESVGKKTDRGEVGFNPGPGRQFLIFPKSLKPFAGRPVVAIKYDLIASPEVPKGERAKPARAPKRAKPKPVPKPRHEKPKAEPKDNVVAFKKPVELEEAAEEHEGAARLKDQIRHAMRLLEDGKAVAAFNVLKRAVSSN